MGSSRLLSPGGVPPLLCRARKAWAVLPDPDAPSRTDAAGESTAPTPALPRDSAMSNMDVTDWVAPSAGIEEGDCGAAGRAFSLSAGAAESTSSRTSQIGASGSTGAGASETESEMDFSGGAKTGTVSATGTTTVCATVSPTRLIAVSARDTTGAAICAGRDSDVVRALAAAAAGGTISSARDDAYSGTVTGAGGAVAGSTFKGGARTGMSGSFGWAAGATASIAFRACVAKPGLSVPLLPTEVAGAVIPPTRASPAGWALASAAGAEKDSQAMAAAPAMRTGRTERSRDQDDTLLAMLDTPRYANSSIIVYSLSLKESGSPEL